MDETKIKTLWDIVQVFVLTIFRIKKSETKKEN